MLFRSTGRIGIEDLPAEAQSVAREWMPLHADWKSRTKQASPKYEQYTIPGGENYREVLLTLPSEAANLDKRRREIEALGRNATEEQKSEWASIMNRLQPDNRDIEGAPRFRGAVAARDYQSSHWDEPNVLGHLRMSDRTGPEGEKILHLEELQSDWGQAGRKSGFREELTPELQEKVNSIASKLDPRFVPSHARDLSGKGIDTENFLLRDINHWKDSGVISNEDANILTKYANIKSGIGLPSAPHITSTQGWTDLGLKRALKEAAEGGYNKLIWTPGTEQAKRYDLSKQVKQIHYIKTPDGKYLIAPETHAGQEIPINQGQAIDANKISDYLGKDVAEKIINGEEKGVLEGNDLTLGGEGMKSFYDKILPTQLQKLVKKLDPNAKIEMGGHKIKGKEGELGAHVLHITPELRKRILEGLPAFERGGFVNNSDPYENVRKAAKITSRARRGSH